MPSEITSGLIALHGNQLELLRDAVFNWLRAHPLAPLEQETFLVQSNGIADWLKISLAEQMGVCAGTRVALPARFVWDAYRQVLGPELVPPQSVFDRQPLTWRLMQLLPTLVDQPAFAPLKYFLKDGSPERRLQLAQKLADLFDQYQVYRANWLLAWANGEDVLIDATGQRVPLAPHQCWQAQLWRAVCSSVPAQERHSGRADIHQQFINTLAANAVVSRLPRRVVLFGVSALPYQTLEALGALARHIQVIVAVPNPCQHYWGDIISGHDLLKAQRRRQQHCPRRGDLSMIPAEQLHAHCHPLLSAWGRLGRDFIRMLDGFDDAEATRQAFPNLRIDLFSEGEGQTLLAQIQASIREMLPPQADPEQRPVYRETDESVRFHVAHSVQREVEVLHDQLLAMFAGTPAGRSEQDGDSRIKPRDVVVMVPDIEKFSPSIRAVFGQYPAVDKRHIPFEIADVSERRINPMLVALDWLLRLPQQRCLQSEVRDLLDVPAIAARFGIAQQDLPKVAQWVEASGVRWGLDRQHRTALELGPAGEQNAWIFGIRRMLLGYANGAEASYDGIEPFAQVGGLDAALAGSLANFVDRLLHWRQELSTPRAPAEWGVTAQALLRDFFRVTEERDHLTMAQISQSLHRWLEHCAHADFTDRVPVAILREAWLGPIDDKALHQHFMAGGVTFCTLMPMRAVPYRVVCLLGMNDGDFPRRAQRADFDLLALPRMACPGDRSRREDDRYLMLEALLSARDHLYISWVGRNVRDNSIQPPSVLVTQLQDYLKAGWKNLDLARLTIEHPLQPFSRRYFEHGSLHTYATEWRAAYERKPGTATQTLPAYAPASGARLGFADLAYFLKQPVKQFFRRRLNVQFGEQKITGLDDEPFSLNKLEEYQICERLLADKGPPEAPHQVQAQLHARFERLRREGRLPIGHLAQKKQQELVEELAAVRTAWLAQTSRFPKSMEKIPVFMTHADHTVEDWLNQVRKDGEANVWLSLMPGRVLEKGANGNAPDTRHLRPDKLIGGYVRQLLLCATDNRITGYFVTRDCIVQLHPIDADAARAQAEVLLSLWIKGMSSPLPTACKTALALLAKDAKKAMDAYDGLSFAIDGLRPERAEPCLARMWPDYAALAAHEEHEAVSRQLYQPLLDWIIGSVDVFPLNHSFARAEAA
jgi:exodeoxyribonuclease V gamma subunit